MASVCLVRVGHLGLSLFKLRFFITATVLSVCWLLLTITIKLFYYVGDSMMGYHEENIIECPRFLS